MRSCSVLLKGVAVPALICLLSLSCSDDSIENVVDTRVQLIAVPQLECIEGEVEFSPPVEYATDFAGAATAEDALRPGLEVVAAGRGEGEIVRLSDFQYGLVVDGRIVTIEAASETRPGEWHLVDTSYCELAGTD